MPQPPEDAEDTATRCARNGVRDLLYKDREQTGKDEKQRDAREYADQSLDADPQLVGALPRGMRNVSGPLMMATRPSNAAAPPAMTNERFRW